MMNKRLMLIIMTFSVILVGVWIKLTLKQQTIQVLDQKKYQNILDQNQKLQKKLKDKNSDLFLSSKNKILTDSDTTNNTAVSRAPASLAPAPGQLKTSPQGSSHELTINHRPLIGISSEQKRAFLAGKIPFAFRNKVSHDWDDRLKRGLASHCYKPCKFRVEHELSYIEIQDQDAYYREKVLISVTTEKNSRYSYHASVESSSGVIIRTWNHTQIEQPFGHQPASFEVELDQLQKQAP